MNSNPKITAKLAVAQKRLAASALRMKKLIARYRDEDESQVRVGRKKEA